MRDGTNLTKLTAQFPNSHYTVDSTSGHLSVKGATYNDTGVYLCVATNKAGSDSANITVDVEGESTACMKLH